MANMVSVVVPIYNAEKYLARCIESIRSQTYDNIEIILINDGSTDSSLYICNHFSSIDKRITVIDKENEGVSITRNKGIKIAKGDYIGFVDSDDYVEEVMYEHMVKRIQEDNSQLCALTNYTINTSKRYNNINLNGTITGSEALEYLCYLSFPTSLWAYLYSREVIKDLFLNERVHYFEDFEFNAHVLNKSNKVSLCYEKLYNYTSNDESINAQDINDKKITCLSIYDNFLDTEIPGNIVKSTSFFRAYFFISTFVSLNNSKKKEKKYLNILKKEARVLIWTTLISLEVPIKYKAVIFVCAINVQLACEMYYLLH